MIKVKELKNGTFKIFSDKNLPIKDKITNAIHSEYVVLNADVERYEENDANLINETLKSLNSDIVFNESETLVVANTEPEPSVVENAVVRVVQEYPYVENNRDNLDKIKYYAEDENGIRYKLENDLGEMADYFIEDYPCLKVFTPTNIKAE